MANKREREQKQQGHTPNLGQKEAQQQQRGDSELSQLGERTREDQRDHERDKGKGQQE